MSSCTMQEQQFGIVSEHAKSSPTTWNVGAKSSVLAARETKVSKNAFFSTTLDKTHISFLQCGEPHCKGSLEFSLDSSLRKVI